MLCSPVSGTLYPASGPHPPPVLEGSSPLTNSEINQSCRFVLLHSTTVLMAPEIPAQKNFMFARFLCKMLGPPPEGMSRKTLYMCDFVALHYPDSYLISLCVGWEVLGTVQITVPGTCTGNVNAQFFIKRSSGF